MPIRRATALVVMIAVLTAGCAARSDLMKPTGQSPASLRPEPDKALVVFLRPEYLGYAIQAVVYDGDSYIGVVSRFAAVPFDAAPGHHRFMVVSEAADFLDADLVAGRTYFVEVVPRMGVWRARFSLAPWDGNRDRGKIASALAEAKVVRTNEKGREWDAENRNSVLAKKAEYEPEWLQKPDRPSLPPDAGWSAADGNPLP